MNIIYELILFFTLLKAIVLVRKFKLSNQNYLLVYLIGTFLVELFSRGIILIYKDSNWSMQYNLYALFCILFFWFYFSRLFSPILKKITAFVVVIVLVFIVCHTKILGQDFDQRLGIVLSLFYILCSMLWFYQKISLPANDKITNDPNFWISTALLLWSCFFIFRVIPMYLFNDIDKEFSALLRSLNYVIDVIMYMMFYIALVKYEVIAKKEK